MDNPVLIGTRDSQLAVWQANQVKAELLNQGIETKLIFIKSQGDKIQDKLIGEMNNVGVFTKALDDALLNHEIDIAVHSYKDVPTKIHPELIVAAVLKRGEVADALVLRDNDDFLNSKNISATIATGSPRRKAFWLNKFPHHQVEAIRGNVNSRLEKLFHSDWDGTILALAGLQRLNLTANLTYKKLDWMIPAPAQGAMAVTCRAEDQLTAISLSNITDSESKLMTGIERDFLSIIESGCSAPVGAYANVRENKVEFTACVLSRDGQERIDVILSAPIDSASSLGVEAANIALQKGAKKLIEKDEQKH